MIDTTGNEIRRLTLGYPEIGSDDQAILRAAATRLDDLDRLLGLLDDVKWDALMREQRLARRHKHAPVGGPIKQ